MAALSGGAILFEFDALFDALDQIQAIHFRLAKRHGERFRALEREIENLPSSDFGEIHFESIGGAVIFHAPEAFTKILKRAAELGV